MSDTKEKTKTLTQVLSELGVQKEEVHKLILFNDDINSFDWVILCLMGILNFTYDKALETAMEVHTKGKCLIKTGSFDELKPYKQSLEERGLTLEIQK